MRLKISLKWLWVFVGTAGIVFASIVIFFLGPAPRTGGVIPQKPIPLAGAPIPQNVPQSNGGLPIRLTIPKIKVDAAVEYVGLTPQGAMDVPKGPADVAWFNLGPRPGEVGAAVIAGHEGWKDGIPAVFDNLYQLQKGDEFSVAVNNGTEITFVVRDIRTFGQGGDASAVFGASDGVAHLNLITCEGTWNKIQKSYSDRLVVFADEKMD
jgi:sortase A